MSSQVELKTWQWKPYKKQTIMFMFPFYAKSSVGRFHVASLSQYNLMKWILFSFYRWSTGGLNKVICIVQGHPKSKWET